MNNHQKKDNFKINTFKQPTVDFGLTTGSLATATSLAALKKIICPSEVIDIVKISTPFDEFDVDIKGSNLLDKNKAESIAVKYPYNDPDVTVNLKIISLVELIDKSNYNNSNKSNYNADDKSNNNESNYNENDKLNHSSNILIKGGSGVGIITKPGLQIPVGKHAINPVPLAMIEKNLKDIVPKSKIAKVTISVEGGEKIAKKTMNPKLGIVGGISILGTTGIARAMSNKAYKDSLTCQLDMAMALAKEGKYKIDNLVFVPGNIGERLALKNLTVREKKVEKDQIIQMGNYVGFMLEEAKKRGIAKLILFGHIGKLVKIAGGIFNTKHSVADGRREIIATHAGLCGSDTETIKKIFDSKTTEEMIDILKEKGINEVVFNSIGLTIGQISLERFDLDVEVVLVDMEGNRLN